MNALKQQPDRAGLVYDMIDTGRQLYQKQLIVATEGNFSVRNGLGSILCTTGGVNKGFLTPADLVVVNLRGEPLEGGSRPTSEIELHLEVYRNRPDVNAVIHAHPAFCIALMLAGLKLDKPLTPESVLVLGKVPVAAYARPSTPQVAESIRPYIHKTDCILLDRHGSLTVGNTLAEALHKLEIMEKLAKVYLAAVSTGNVLELDRFEVAELLQRRTSAYGISWPILSY